MASLISTPTSGDPTGFLTQLGVFSVTLVILLYVLRELLRRNDRLTEVIEQQTPLLTQVRDALVAAADAIDAQAAASTAHAEAVRAQQERMPSVADMVRAREALERVERALRARPPKAGS